MAKILVVDDDSVTRQLITFQLGSGQHDIHTAPSGAVALAMLGFERFDLVITDLYMPGLSGVGLMERARVRYRLPHLPFIMISATTGLGETMPVVASEFAAMLEKPVDVQELLAAVDSTLLNHTRMPSRHVH